MTRPGKAWISGFSHAYYITILELKNTKTKIPLSLPSPPRTRLRVIFFFDNFSIFYVLATMNRPKAGLKE